MATERVIKRTDRGAVVVYEESEQERAARLARAAEERRLRLTRGQREVVERAVIAE